MGSGCRYVMLKDELYRWCGPDIGVSNGRRVEREVVEVDGMVGCADTGVDAE